MQFGRGSSRNLLAILFHVSTAWKNAYCLSAHEKASSRCLDFSHRAGVPSFHRAALDWKSATANILLTEFVHRQGSSERLRALAGICLLFLILGFGRGYAAANGNAAPSLGGAATESVADMAADFTATLPHVGGPAGYVGSKACRS